MRRGWLIALMTASVSCAILSASTLILSLVWLFGLGGYYSDGGDGGMATTGNFFVIPEWPLLLLGWVGGHAVILAARCRTLRWVSKKI
jgi:hypothetical protein